MKRLRLLVGPNVVLTEALDQRIATGLVRSQIVFGVVLGGDAEGNDAFSQLAGRRTGIAIERVQYAEVVPPQKLFDRI